MVPDCVENFPWAIYYALCVRVTRRYSRVSGRKFRNLYKVVSVNVLWAFIFTRFASPVAE